MSTETPVRTLPPEPVADRPPAGVHRGVWLVAAGLAAVELAVSARYGFHRDELYFLVAGAHPAAGYVDQPPLAPLLARLAAALGGPSPTAVRVLPALAGAGVVLVAGRTARVLGGGRRAQLVAALATAAAPVLLAAAHLANTTGYDLLATSAVVLLATRAVLERSGRHWLAAGVVAGLGLENKDLLVLVVAALVAGLVAVGPRAALRGRWPWAALCAAVALAAPDLVWQAVHGWPVLAMDRALRAEHSTGADYLSVLPAQWLYVGLAAGPLVVAGARELAGRRETRFLAVAAAAVLAVVAATVPGRPYYTAGLLPLLLAAGAVRAERRWPPRGRRYALAAPLLCALVGLPLELPVLPVSALARVPALHKINYDLGETVGWPQLAARVGDVWRSLPPADRAHASVFTANYGEAGALARYAPALPVLSGHNTYWLWGPGHASDRVVVAVGADPALLADFARCRLAAVLHSPHGVADDENGAPVRVCTGARGSWPRLWPGLRVDG